MSTPEHEDMERNIRRTAGIRSLKGIRHIVDQDLNEEAARTKLMRVFLRFGWIVLLLASGLLARYFGVI